MEPSIIGSDREGRGYKAATVIFDLKDEISDTARAENQIFSFDVFTIHFTGVLQSNGFI
jgi:hypothetical protein